MTQVTEILQHVMTYPGHRNPAALDNPYHRNSAACDFQCRRIFAAFESPRLMFCLHVLSISQSIPNGKPNLVTPSLAKLDVDSLKRDILNKYPQNMPRVASDDWRVWLENVETEIASVPDHYDWPIEKLKAVTRTVPPPSATQLPDNLLELREREIQPTPEVSVKDL